jgi:hypothetical protein
VILSFKKTIAGRGFASLREILSLILMYEKPEIGMGHLVKPSPASIPKSSKILNPQKNPLPRTSYPHTNN